MVGLLLCVSHFDQIFGVKRLWQSVSAAPLHCMSHVKEEFSSLHSSLGFFFFYGWWLTTFEYDSSIWKTQFSNVLDTTNQDTVKNTANKEEYLSFSWIKMEIIIQWTALLLAICQSVYCVFKIHDTLSLCLSLVLLQCHQNLAVPCPAVCLGFLHSQSVCVCVRAHVYVLVLELSCQNEVFPFSCLQGRYGSHNFLTHPSLPAIQGD